MTWADRVSTAVAALGVPAILAPRGPLIVTYHAIGGSDGIPVDRLREQLTAFRSRRQVVPLIRALELLGTPQAAEVGSISFDDGYKDFADLAMPVLEDLDLHATLFVPTAHLGGFNCWDVPARPRRELLSASDLRQLPPERVSVGAHGLTHVRLAGLAQGKLSEETHLARCDLENAIGREVRLFAYPYGQMDDFDAQAEHAVEAAGYVAACSTCFGRGSLPEDRFRLSRVGVEEADTLGVFERKLDGAYDWFRTKERLASTLRRWRNKA